MNRLILLVCLILGVAAMAGCGGSDETVTMPDQPAPPPAKTDQTAVMQLKGPPAEMPVRSMPAQR